MDSFTENILARARERQKLLENYTEPPKFSPKRDALSRSPRKVLQASSQPNLTSSPRAERVQNFSSEGNVSKSSGRTRVSSEITSSPNCSPKLKTLNIKNDNFNMEIKVSSAENVRLEVQIEEQSCSDDENSNGENSGGLRPDAKNRLNRLGKLYAGGDDANISSPIHRSEAKFNIADPTPKSEVGQRTKKGLRRLADLAQNIHQWEDDLSTTRKENSQTPAKKSWKPPAPQPPATQDSNSNRASPVKFSAKPKAPNPPKVVAESPKKDAVNVSEKKVEWDRKVLDSLESQGFTRTDSNARLIYKYEPPTKEIKTANTAKVTRVTEKENRISEEREIPEVPKLHKSPQKVNLKIAEKAAIFESSPTKNVKDPALLSVSERKALFEKNKGQALIPKAAFGMATPINSKKESPVKKQEKKAPPPPPLAREFEVKPIVHQAGGIANKVAALLEGKTTIAQEQIETGIRQQRQKEMDMLLNRFHHKTVENEEETVESDNDVTEATAMIAAKVASIIPEKRRSSGEIINKRYSKNDSPKVAAVLSDVKRIKVSPSKAGRLYPSLTDIESTTETDEREDERSPNNSSFAESDDANTSFGRDILRAVCKSQTPQKRNLNDSTNSEMSDILDDMDDYLDEALAYSGGPTPPKCGRQSPVEPSHSFNYKSYQSPMKQVTSPPRRDSGDLPTLVVDGDNVMPLTHTVSFYRKQQNSVNNTPVRQISRQVLVEENEEKEDEDQEEIQKKLVALKNEVAKQEMIISQTSQALNLCNSTPEFMGSTEQVEAERVLLLATHRRQATLNEMQRLRVEKSLKPQGLTSNLPLQKGSLTISRIVLPLKQKYVTALAAAGGKGHHVVCLVKYGEQVIPTPLVSTVVSNVKHPETELSVPCTINFGSVYSDFTVTFEVYCLQAQEEILPHEIKYHIKKPNSKVTPKKSKQDSRLVRPIKESPAGPQAVRSSSFALMGYVVLSLQSVNKKQWILNNTPSMSPLEGTVEMNISCELALSVEHRGFLTMFEDVSGFGAWHRRWCLLKGHVLSYWKYPDDERNSAPINSINLKNCITNHVGPVNREICARLHTFLIEIERMRYADDKESLVVVRKGDKTIVRHLLSADAKEERIEWCNKFNAALAGLKMWGKEKQ